MKNIEKTWKYLKEYFSALFLVIYDGGPWYIFPIRFILVMILIVCNILNTPIRIFPRKFRYWEDFHEHVESIADKLRKNGNADWADDVHYSLYISQSYYERQGELLRVLPALKRQKFAKELKLKKDISKAISYLKSF